MAFFSKGQRGFSVSGLVIFMAVGGFVGITAAKCIPAWMEYMAVKRVINNIESGGDISQAEARKAFDRAAGVDRIESIKGADVDFVSNGKGITGRFEYESRVQLVGNVALLFTFTGQ